MNVDDLKQSRFLSKKDVMPDKLVTIKGYKEMNVAREQDKPDMQCVLYFEETEKLMVLKVTNGSLIAAIIGSKEFEDWIGHKIVLFLDPTVMFGSELKGGIRVRAVRKQKASDAPESDDIPEPDPSITDDSSIVENPDFVGDNPKKPTDDVPF